jgi:hypothetical protein
MVDALFEHLVEMAATRPPEAPLAPPAHVTDLLQRVAAMLADLCKAAHSDRLAGVAPSTPART